MLASTNMLSINQIAAYSTLMEIWKARAFNVPHLSSLLAKSQPRGDRTLRSESAGLFLASIDEPFTVCGAKLWNTTSDRFKTTNLLAIAMSEAKNAVKKLPI